MQKYFAIVYGKYKFILKQRNFKSIKFRTICLKTGSCGFGVGIFKSCSQILNNAWAKKKGFQIMQDEGYIEILEAPHKPKNVIQLALYECGLLEKFGAPRGLYHEDLLFSEPGPGSNLRKSLTQKFLSQNIELLCYIIRTSKDLQDKSIIKLVPGLGQFQVLQTNKYLIIKHRKDPAKNIIIK